MAKTQLSLVAAYDHLMSCCDELTEGIEPDLIQFLEHEFQLRDRLVTDHEELISARQRLESSFATVEVEKRRLHSETQHMHNEAQRLQRQLEEEQQRHMSEMKRMESDKKRLETQLFSARNCIQMEEQKRTRVLQEKDQLERQISVIRQVLIDKQGTLNAQDRDRISFLTNQQQYEESPRLLKSINESVLSDDGIDFDVTEEELDSPRRRRSKRRSLRKIPSAPPEDDVLAAPKRFKHCEDNSVVTTTTITVTADGHPISAETEVTVPSKKLNKSFSEPGLDKLAAEYEDDHSPSRSPMTPHRNKNNHHKDAAMRTPGTPGLRKANSASSGLNRMHFFISETVIRPRTCVPCGKRIGFGKMSMKCKECKSVCHAECKDNLPLPCYHTPATPGKVTGGGLLSDYCRVECPMVPGLVIHCVNEVEARGLEETGIYRMSGTDREVKELKEKFFKGRGLPNMSNIDINVVCCCLKDFLRGLKEPIITYRLWRDFYNAAENPDKIMGQSDTYQALSQLPRANKDTLAFLMLHLHRVSQSPKAMMPVMNLVKVFGPTLVGHSVENPEPLMVVKEIKCQSMVMQRMFEIPEDYWKQFMKDDDDNMYQNENNTPHTPGLMRSRLGPVLTPGSAEKDKTPTWTRNTYSARSHKTNLVKKPSHFFNSPRVPDYEY